VLIELEQNDGKRANFSKAKISALLQPFYQDRQFIKSDVTHTKQPFSTSYVDIVKIDF
jgi:hypothetical protein